jgi:Ca-activated chloride channel family protein
MLRLLVAVPLIVGLARPQLGQGRGSVQASGVDLMLAVDVSGSMEALDFTLGGQPISRVEVVKSVVSRFIEARPNDRIGLVAFAGAPYLVSPLTLDHDWLKQNLDRVKIGLIEDSTAIGSALATCVNRLRDQPSKSKVVVLLTDGMNNAGKVAPQTAAEAAKAMGVKVYTIAAGAQGEAPMPVKDQFGNQRVVMAKVDVDGDWWKILPRHGYRFAQEDLRRNRSHGKNRAPGQKVRAIPRTVRLRRAPRIAVARLDTRAGADPVPPAAWRVRPLNHFNH